MKIKIEKESQHHNIKIELAASSRSKPMKQEFSREELASVIELLQAALNADNFAMSYETD